MIAAAHQYPKSWNPTGDKGQTTRCPAKGIRVGHGDRRKAKGGYNQLQKYDYPNTHPQTVITSIWSGSTHPEPAMGELVTETSSFVLIGICPVEVALNNRPQVIGDFAAFPEAGFVVRADMIASKEPGFGSHVCGLGESGHAQSHFT